MINAAVPDDVLYGSPEQTGAVQRMSARRGLVGADLRLIFQGRTVCSATRDLALMGKVPVTR
ncbi:MAG: hypothetical protein AAF409_08270 [Pseudomonadota bacterium]